MAGQNTRLAEALDKQLAASKALMQKQTKTYANVSLCGCTVTNPFRDKIIQIVLNPWFDRFILMTIFLNCIVLAYEDPMVESDPIIEIFDLIFLIIFSVEMVLKIIAFGFVMQPYSYLRDPWNILDFLVVILGWVTMWLKSWNISSIRVIRILRPLRTLNSLQGMRGLVLTLLNSLPSMLNILILFVFTLVIFGTIGMQLFKGVFRNRCVLDASRNETDWSQETYQTNRDGDEIYCKKYNDETKSDCLAGYTCLERENPGVGIAHYDNIFAALLVQFELITLEGWSGFMYMARNANQGSLLFDSFFIVSVVFGAFFVLNLMIAVQFNFLDEAFNEIEENKEIEKQKFQLDYLESADEKENDDQEEGAEKKKKRCRMPSCLKRLVCCDCWLRMSENIRKVLLNNEHRIGFAYTSILTLFIILNSIVLATEFYNQPQWLTDFQNIANVVFTIIFAIEMVIALIGLGVKGYVSDGFNIFDGIIVVFSLLELGLAAVQGENEQGGFITVLRGFRLLRIFKLAKSWTTLTQLLTTIIQSLPAISNLAVLQFLFLFVYALVGKQFFKGPLDDGEGGISRYHFQTTKDSLVTMFIVLTGENWNEVMEIVIDNYPEFRLLAIGFFVSAILIGNFMLLNLFLAILLKFLQDAVLEQERAKERLLQEKLKEETMAEIQRLNQQIEQKMQKQKQAKQLEHQEFVQKFENPALQQSQQPSSIDNQQAKNESDANEEIEAENKITNLQTELDANQKDDQLHDLEQQEALVDAIISGKPPVAMEFLDGQKEKPNNNQHEIASEHSQKDEKIANFAQKVEEKEGANDEFEGPPTTNNIDNNDPFQKQQQVIDQSTMKKSVLTSARRTTDYTSSMQKNVSVLKKRKRLNEIIVEGKSLFIFSEKSLIRIKIARFVENPYFESFIFHLIGLNSLFLAIEEPSLTDEYTKATLQFFGDIVSGLFILECLLKIYVMGFVIGKHAYLKDSYNILDFTIVFFSIVSWVIESNPSLSANLDISFVKAFRALRALRPLKLVSKNEGMKLVVNSLISSIPKLMNVMLISTLFFFVFGVIGLQLLMGRVSYCDGDADLSKLDCESAGFSWLLPPNHYNNIFASMTTFFEVSTLETWPDIMFAAMDSSGQMDEAPQLNQRWFLSMLFIIFIFITTFFVMNLFISVIVRQFNEQKLKNEGSANLTSEQLEWVKIQRFMAEVRPPVREQEPKEKTFRRYIYNVIRHDAFEYFITFVILLNTLGLCMDFYGQPLWYKNMLDYANNYVFVVIFTVEAIMKLIGLGPSYYFYIDWNKFDFFIVILSIVSAFSDEDSSYNLTAFRIIRVARLLRMIKSSKQLQSLLKTLYLAMNNIANVALLFMLIIFTFAVAGMTLFGDIDIGEYGAIKRDNLNFHTFYESVNLLLRSSTGESWNVIMHDCVYEKGQIAVFYWLAFQMLGFFIFMNVFIAVIYEEFQNVNQVESNLEVLSLKKRDIYTFLECWSKMNPNGEVEMPTDKFRDFMQQLPAPLGYKGLQIGGSKLDKIIYCLNIRDREGKVYFPEVMWAIFYSIIGKNDKALNQCKPMRSIMRKVKNKYTKLGRNTTLDLLCGNKFYRREMTVTKYLCGKHILHKLMIKLAKNRRCTQSQLQQQFKQKHQKKSNYFSLLFKGINKTPAQMHLDQESVELSPSKKQIQEEM